MAKVISVIVSNKKVISLDVSDPDTNFRISKEFVLHTLSENESLQMELRGRTFLNREECLTILTDICMTEEAKSFLEEFIRKIIEKYPPQYIKTNDKWDDEKIHKEKEFLRNHIINVIKTYIKHEDEILKNLFFMRKNKLISSIKLFDLARESNLKLPKWFEDIQIKRKKAKKKDANAREKIKKLNKTIENRNKDIEKLQAENEKLRIILKEQANNCKKKRATDSIYLMAAHVCALHDSDSNKYSFLSISRRIEEYTKRSITSPTIAKHYKEIKERFKISDSDKHKKII